MDVVLAIDTSSSMEERTAAGVRKLGAAIWAAGTFLDQMHFASDDRAAIVAFDADARLVRALTRDRSALDAALRDLRTSPQTCLPCAVNVSAAELEADRRAGAMRVLVLLTDGRSNPRPVSEAVASARAAKDAGVTVFIVGLGVDLDAALSEMVSFPAAFLRVADAGALAAAYAEVARTLPCPPAGYWGRR